MFFDPPIMAASTGCTLGINQTASDPMFVNATTEPYDFHLLPGSPAIDSGTPVPGVVTDFDGNPRPQGSAYDIGAFEFTTQQSSSDRKKGNRIARNKTEASK